MTEDSKPIPRWLAGDHYKGFNKIAARSIVVVGMPFMLAWCPLAELVRGFARAFGDAWLEARCLVSEGRGWWRGGIKLRPVFGDVINEDGDLLLKPMPNSVHVDFARAGVVVVSLEQAAIAERYGWERRAGSERNGLVEICRGG